MQQALFKQGLVDVASDDGASGAVGERIRTGLLNNSCHRTEQHRVTSTRQLMTLHNHLEMTAELTRR